MSSVKAAIFDIGRVLVRVDVARAMNGLAGAIPLGPKEIWSAIEKDPHWPDLQEGRMSARDWHLHITKRLGGSLSYERFCDAWNAALDPEPIHPDSLLADLKKNCRIGLLSNTDPVHRAFLENTYSFFRFVPEKARIFSCSVGSSKPSPIIYQLALKAVKAKANETVFVDDLEANVEAARKLGMRGIHYESPDVLRAELVKLGLLASV